MSCLSLLRAFLFLLILQASQSASVGRGSANNESQSDIDLVLDLLSGININASDLNADLEPGFTISSSAAPQTAQNTVGSKPGRPQSLKDSSEDSHVLGVPKLSLERPQSKGIDAYYPKGTQSLRNFAKNDAGPAGLWSLFGRSSRGPGVPNPFRSITTTLFGGKGSLRQKLWLVKELFREEEQNRRRQTLDRTAGDLRTRLMRSMVQKTFNHYKKNTAMMEMVVQDRNERLQRFMDIPGVSELLKTNDIFSNENDSTDALSLLSESFFSVGGFLRNQA